MRGARLAKTAGLMMILILASRLLGFVRLRAIGEVFGRTWQTDALNASFYIPDFMYYLLVGGALTSAFIPVFTSYLATKSEDEAWLVASSFLNVTVSLLVLTTIAGISASPLLAPLVAYGFEGEQRELLIYLTRIMFPAVFFTAMAGLGAGILNSYHHFSSPYIGSILYNIFIIGGAYILGPRLGIVGVAVGTVIGAMTNFLLQFFMVLRKGHRYRLTVDLSHPGIRKILRLMGPSLIGLAIPQINLVISQNIASGLSEGSITALQFANRLMQFPLGVFAMGLSQVMFPTMTKLVAQGELDQFRDTLSRGLRTILFIIIPSAAGFIALGEPIVAMLFRAGEFGASDVKATAYALLFYSFGLISQSGIQILTRAYYSLHDTKTPVKIGAVSILVNTALSLGLVRYTALAHGGLALAFSLTSATSMFISLVLLRRKLKGIRGRKLIVTLSRSALAAGIMAFLIHQFAGWLTTLLNVNTASGRAIQVFTAIAAGAAIYGLLALALRMEEASYLLRLLRNRFRRKPAQSQ